jgi:hypothetical protein
VIYGQSPGPRLKSRPRPLVNMNDKIRHLVAGKRRAGRVEHIDCKQLLRSATSIVTTTLLKRVRYGLESGSAAMFLDESVRLVFWLTLGISRNWGWAGGRCSMLQCIANRVEPTWKITGLRTSSSSGVGNCKIFLFLSFIKAPVHTVVNPGLSGQELLAVTASRVKRWSIRVHHPFAFSIGSSYPVSW